MRTQHSGLVVWLRCGSASHPTASGAVSPTLTGAGHTEGT